MAKKKKKQRQQQRRRPHVPADLQARLDALIERGLKEVADVDIFASPPPLGGECPLCCIPTGVGAYSQTRFIACCGQSICAGCYHGHAMHQMFGGEKRRSAPSCPFCRTEYTKDLDERKHLDIQMQKDSPMAFGTMGLYYLIGKGVEQNDEKALGASIKCAELGETMGYSIIQDCLFDRFGADERVLCALAEVAAKKGDVTAIRHLGEIEEHRGSELAIDYFKVAASGGEQNSLNKVMDAYREEKVSKGEIDKVMRSFQEYTNILKTKERDEAMAWMNMTEFQRDECISKFSKTLRQRQH